MSTHYKKIGFFELRKNKKVIEEIAETVHYCRVEALQALLNKAEVKNNPCARFFAIKQALFSKNSRILDVALTDVPTETWSLGHNRSPLLFLPLIRYNKIKKNIADVTTDGMPLNALAETGRQMAQLIDRLIQAGCSVKTLNGDNTSILLAGVDSGSVDIVKTLIRLGADNSLASVGPDRRVTKPYILAKKNGNKDIIRVLEESFHVPAYEKRFADKWNNGSQKRQMEKNEKEGSSSWPVGVGLTLVAIAIIAQINGCFGNKKEENKENNQPKTEEKAVVTQTTTVQKAQSYEKVQLMQRANQR